MNTPSAFVLLSLAFLFMSPSAFSEQIAKSDRVPVALNTGNPKLKTFEVQGRGSELGKTFYHTELSLDLSKPGMLEEYDRAFRRLAIASPLNGKNVGGTYPYFAISCNDGKDVYRIRIDESGVAFLDGANTKENLGLRDLLWRVYADTQAAGKATVSLAAKDMMLRSLGDCLTTKAEPHPTAAAPQAQPAAAPTVSDHPGGKSVPSSAPAKSTRHGPNTDARDLF